MATLDVVGDPFGDALGFGFRPHVSEARFLQVRPLHCVRCASAATLAHSSATLLPPTHPKWAGVHRVVTESFWLISTSPALTIATANRCPVPARSMAARLIVATESEKVVVTETDWCFRREALTSTKNWVSEHGVERLCWY